LPSSLVEEGLGDIDIWQGSNLTKKEIDILEKKIFKGKKVDFGYTKENYPNIKSFKGADKPGAIVFNEGKVRRMPSKYQKRFILW